MNSADTRKQPTKGPFLGEKYADAVVILAVHTRDRVISKSHLRLAAHRNLCQQPHICSIGRAGKHLLEQGHGPFGLALKVDRLLGTGRSCGTVPEVTVCS